MIKTNHQPIAILGGMGPDASARLYQLMIELARSEFGAVQNHDYPEIVIDSVPVREFFSSPQKATEAIISLQDRIKKLDGFQPSCLALACNTAHTILMDLAQETKTPFVSIIEEVVKETVKRGYKKVGLLASPTTIFSGVYQTEFIDKGVELVLPENGYIEQLGEIIGQIVGGEFKKPKARLLKIANSLKKKKVEAMVLGCTELPLVFPMNYSLPIINSLEVLGRSLLTRYYKGEDI
ncbi:MAG: amino acid racemase [Candidatus Beckwithbacteria bacterium]